MFKSSSKFSCVLFRGLKSDIVVTQFPRYNQTNWSNLRYRTARQYIITPCSVSLAIRQSPYTKGTSPITGNLRDYKGQHILKHLPFENGFEENNFPFEYRALQCPVSKFAVQKYVPIFTYLGHAQARHTHPPSTQPLAPVDFFIA